MDFLVFDSKFRVLICSRCKYALVPGTLDSHLSSLHKNDITRSERRECVEIWKNKPLQSPQAVQQLNLPLDTSPIPNLALFYNGMRCSLCTERPYICSKGNIHSMRDHLQTFHKWKSGHKGGRPTNAVLASQDLGAEKQTVLSAVTIAPVYYQTFYRSNFTRFFQVATPLQPDSRAPEADGPPLPASLEA
jgi:hypothetical protein